MYSLNIKSGYIFISDNGRSNDACLGKEKENLSNDLKKNQCRIYLIKYLLFVWDYSDLI